MERLINKIFDWAVLTALFISPLAYMTGRSFETFDIIIFQIFSIIFMILYFLQWHIEQIRIESLWIFISTCTLSVIFGRMHNIAVFNLINLILGAFIVQVVAENFKSHKLLFPIIVIPVVLNLIICFFQNIGFSPIIENLTQFGAIAEPGGLLGNAPRLCMYMAIILPIIFAESFLVALGFSIIGVLLNEIYLPLFFIVLWLIKTESIKTIFFISLVMFFSLIFYTGKIIQSFTIRFPIWIPTLEQAFTKPIFGYGLGIFPQVSEQFIKSYYYADNAMSSLIQFFFSVGFVGLVGLGYFLWKFPIKSSYGMSVIFLGILSLIEYPFEVPKLWLTISIIIGLALGKTPNDKSKRICLSNTSEII